MSTTPAFCAACGKPVPADARFCRSCGAPQNGATTPDAEAVVTPEPARAARQPQSVVSAPTPRRAAANVQERRRLIVGGAVAAGALLIVLVGKALFASPSKASPEALEAERLRPVLASPSVTAKREPFEYVKYVGTWKANEGGALSVAQSADGSQAAVTLDGKAGLLHIWGTEPLDDFLAVLSVAGKDYAAEVDTNVYGTNGLGKGPILYLWDGARIRVFRQA